MESIDNRLLILNLFSIQKLGIQNLYFENYFLDWNTISNLIFYSEFRNRDSYLIMEKNE